MAVEAEVVTDDSEGGGDSGKGGAGFIPRDYGFFACYDSVYPVDTMVPYYSCFNNLLLELGFFGVVERPHFFFFFFFFTSITHSYLFGMMVLRP